MKYDSSPTRYLKVLQELDNTQHFITASISY